MVGHLSVAAHGRQIGVIQTWRSFSASSLEAARDGCSAVLKGVHMNGHMVLFRSKARYIECTDRANEV